MTINGTGMQQQGHNHYSKLSRLMKLCAENPERFRFQRATRATPAHWETMEGKVLWLHKKLDTKKKINSSFSVRLATHSELMNNPEIQQGAVAFSNEVNSCQQELEERSLESLDKESIRWAPSITNKAQSEDLIFSHIIEKFLSHYNSKTKSLCTFTDRIKQFFSPLCLGLEGDSIVMYQSHILLPTPSIQRFKTSFNRMIERRVYLLNRWQTQENKSLVSYIPLGLESDCTPACVTHKLNSLSETEMQMLMAIVSEHVGTLAKELSITKHPVSKLLKPLLNVTNFWCTLWPTKKNEVYKHVITQLSALSFHSGLKNRQPQIENTFKKAEILLREITH